MVRTTGLLQIIVLLLCLRVFISIISVVLVTGGSTCNTSVKISAELLSSNGTRLCTLPNLPGPRYSHSQTGLLLCGGGSGGYADGTTCMTLSGGRWKKTHTLGKRRYEHAAWASPQGVLLMGGRGEYRTTEFLNDDGTTTPGFKLKNHR